MRPQSAIKKYEKNMFVYKIGTCVLMCLLSLILCAQKEKARLLIPIHLLKFISLDLIYWSDSGSELPKLALRQFLGF